MHSATTFAVNGLITYCIARWRWLVCRINSLQIRARIS